jgi:GMP synthase PP-ATPase subunit
MVTALRAVRTIDFMAARRARLPYEFLDRFCCIWGLLILMRPL